MSRDKKPSDHHLWDEVRKSVRPLGSNSWRRQGAASNLQKPSDSNHRTVVSPSAELPTFRPFGRAQHSAPPLQTLDRRTAQKLGRGQVEPEAHLDLHGDSLEAARMRLLHFLAEQRHRGNRVVLVITGKGASPFARHTLHGHGHFHAPEREGRLRRELPHWLSEEQFRIHVVGFQPSHPRHGGGGAFYVRLRKHQPLMR